MKRKREQAGWVGKVRGNWVCKFRETVSVRGKPKTIHRQRILAPVDANCKTKAAARKLADRIIEPINERKAPPESVILLSEFIEDRYLPYVKDTLRPSTYHGYRQIWLRYWKPLVEGVWLRNVQHGQMIDWMTEIAKPKPTQLPDGRRVPGRILSKRTLTRIRNFASGAFRQAKEEGLLDEHQVNPVLGVRLPQWARPDGVREQYTLAEINKMLEVLDDPVATLIVLAFATGLRRGELKGLRWEDYSPAPPKTDDDSEHEYDFGIINVRRSVWQRFTTDPKTDSSKCAVPLLPAAEAWLNHWRKKSGNPETGFVFPNAKGEPRDLDALCHPAAKVLNRVGIRWRGLHACRKALGTELDRRGVKDTMIQRALRHDNVNTTRDHYIGDGKTSEAQEALRPLAGLIVLPRTITAPADLCTGVVQ